MGWLIEPADTSTFFCSLTAEEVEPVTPGLGNPVPEETEFLATSAGSTTPSAHHPVRLRGQRVQYQGRTGVPPAGLAIR